MKREICNNNSTVRRVHNIRFIMGSLINVGEYKSRFQMLRQTLQTTIEAKAQCSGKYEGSQFMVFLSLLPRILIIYSVNLKYS